MRLTFLKELTLTKELNTLLLSDVKWVDEEEDALFNFDTKKYFYASKAKVIVSINF